jgi:hypothetical protein
MSSSVSQIQYWREVNEPNGKKSNINASEGGPGAEYLSYNVFLGLSVLGGALALDHLYLRSPLTFLVKIILNILTLGTWWLYDATQAIFNRDVIKVYGLSVPGLGPKGIGAGCLANDNPDKKHMAFFFYGLAVILGGMFGLDSFIVGDKQSGFIRLVCLITGIFAPIAIFWWIYNLFKFFFQTKDVTNTYWEYFGAPQPAEQTMTILQKIVAKFPFLERFVGPAMRAKDKVINTATQVGQKAVDIAEAAVDDPTVLLTAPIDIAVPIITAPIEKIGTKIGEVSEKVSTQLKPAINKAIKPATQALQVAIEPATQAIETAIQPAIQAVQPIKQTINTGLGVAQTGIATAQQGIALGQSALSTGKNIASKTLNTIGDTAKAATSALTLAPSAMALTSGFTPAAAQQALTKLEQKGGMIQEESGILPYVLVGTLGIIVVSGLVLTYRRLRQNEQPRKDDSPPEPRVPGKSNKEKSS